MNIWDGEYAFSIQAAFRSESIALSHPVIGFQLALVWSSSFVAQSADADRAQSRGCPAGQPLRADRDP